MDTLNCAVEMISGIAIQQTSGQHPIESLTNY